MVFYETLVRIISGGVIFGVGCYPNQLSLVVILSGRIRFKNTPTIVARPTPLSVKAPAEKVMPPIPNTRISATIKIFLRSVNAVAVFFKQFTEKSQQYRKEGRPNHQGRLKPF